MRDGWSHRREAVYVRSGPVVRVALFTTCFNDTLFPETGRATVRVLERLGHEVEFPMEQTCCGQMHFNTGYQREAIPLVRRFVEVFSPYEAVVAPSGSCVGMVRELFAGLRCHAPRLGRTLRRCNFHRAAFLWRAW